MKATLFILISASFLFLNFTTINSDDPGKPEISSQTQDCISCHESVTPGIVSDWWTSLHSHNSFGIAVKKPELERRVSSKTVANELQNVVVGCYECHGLNAAAHKDNFEHFGYKINIIVSLNDCATCHRTEVTEYEKSKKANALGNLKDNPVYHALVNTTLGVKEIKNDKIGLVNASHFSENETCYGCHGTEIKVIGKTKIESDLGDVEIPKLSDWPNQGVGRINPDGSKGSCTPCHPRHSFSIEIARQPHTCEQCHLEPDVPAYNIYMESKHGNIFESQKEKWAWENVPWTIGQDFKTPTCAV